MSVVADVERVLCSCFSNVLLLALPAFDQVDHIPCLAGGCSTYVEGLVGGCAPNVGVHLDVLQVRQRLVPQGLLPLAGWSPAGLSSALTGRLFFIRAVKLGRFGWYVMTSGILLL